MRRSFLVQERVLSFHRIELPTPETSRHVLMDRLESGTLGNFYAHLVIIPGLVISICISDLVQEDQDGSIPNMIRRNNLLMFKVFAEQKPYNDINR